MQGMMNATPSPCVDTLTLCTQIRHQPQRAANAHAGLDMATVLDLLYATTPSPSFAHASAHTAAPQPAAWA